MKLRFRVPALLLFAAGILMLRVDAAAQTAVEADKLVNVLAKTIADMPPASRAVMERLSSLHELPRGVWKMHAGDLAQIGRAHV